MSETTENSPEPSPMEQGGQVRICGYSQCGRPLPVQNRPGRKAEYCEDRRWEGNKTCKQMAQQERNALKVAGLEAPLAAYREVADRVVPVLESVQAQITGPLGELREVVRQVEVGALARVQDEENTARIATERADVAGAERDKALTARDNAVAEAKAAREAKLLAERLQRDAVADAEQKADRAWQRALEYEGAKTAAEAALTEVRANLEAQVGRYDHLSERFDTVQNANKELTSENTTLKANIKAAEQRAAEADTKAAEATQLAEQRAGEAAAAREAQATAEGERGRIQAENERLVAEVGTLRADLATEKDTTSQLRQQLAAADGREQGLIGERDAATSTAAGLREELATEKDTTSQLRRQVAEQQQTLDTIRAELAETKARAATVEELRALIAPPKK
jgi:chromosome segregation ATPase